MSDNDPLVELATRYEEKKEQDAAAAFERIKSGSHWLDWIAVGEGLMQGREKAMRRAGTNNPVGAAYNRAFGEWMATRPWARELDNPTRNHLFWCAERRSEIDHWRETLAQNVRQRLNHPTAVKRRYEAEHRLDGAKDGAPERLTPKTESEEITRLNGEIAMRDREIEFLKAAPVKDGGSLCDFKRDTLADIGAVFRAHTSLARTRGLRDALTKIIRDEEAELRKKTSKPAG